MNPRYFRHFLAVFTVLSACANAATDYPTEILNDGPLAYYRFNDGVTGLSSDSAANKGSLASDGNGVYTPAFVRSQPGALVGSSNTAGQVNGLGCTIPYQAALNNQGSFTAEIWVKPSVAMVSSAQACPMASIHTADSIRSGWVLYQGGGTTPTATRWNFRTYNENGVIAAVNINSGASTVTVGAWQHVAIVWDNAAKVGKIYVNGVLKTTSPVVPITGTATQEYVANYDANFTLGDRSDSGYAWAGDMDEPAYYNMALSDAQILAHYNNGISASPSPSYDTLVLSDAPVGYWRLDEGVPVPPVATNAGSLGASANGNYYSSSMNTDTGPSTADGFYGFGASNSALALPAGTGHVGTALSLLNNLTTFTVSGWVKRGTAHSTNGGFFGQNDLLELGESSTNLAAYVGVTATTVSTPYSVPNDTWAFVCVTGDGTKDTLYVNGLPVSTVVAPAANYGSNSYKFNIGGGGIWNAVGDFFIGEIDEVAVFNKTLSSARIKELYNVALSTPVLYWTAADSSSPTTWDIDTTSNWKVGPTGPASTYNDTVSVVFDDSAGGAGVVDLETDVMPQGIVFNGTKNYTLMSSWGYAIDGSTGLTKNGPATLEIATENYHTGPTTVNQGILKTGAANPFGDGNLVFGPGSTGKVQLNGNSVYVAGISTDTSTGTPILESGSSIAGTDELILTNDTNQIFGGVLQDGGVRGLSLDKGGSGTLTLTGANTYSGTTTTSGGALRIGNGGTTGSLGSSEVENYGTLEFNRTDSYTVANPITGTGNVSILNGTVNLSGAVTCNSLRFYGGNLTLSGSSPNEIQSVYANNDVYCTLILAKDDGITAFSGPTLDIADSNTGYNSHLVVQLGNSNQIADTTVVNAVGLDYYYSGYAYFRLNGFNETIAGLNKGTTRGTIQNNGANPSVLTLAGAGTYSFRGNIDNGSTGTLSLVLSGSGTQTINETVTPNGTRNQISYTGTTTVNNGKLIINTTKSGIGDVTVNTGGTLGGNGSVAGATTVTSGGSLAPGASVGTLTFPTSLSLAPGSTYAVEINDATSSDKIVVTGALTADGTIAVTLGSNYTPAIDTVFDLADFGSISGTPIFSFTNSSVVAWDTTAFATNGTIKFIGGGDPYDAWATAKGVTGGKAGDDDGDGTSNLMEFATNSDPKNGGSGARVYAKLYLLGTDNALTFTVATLAGAVFAPDGDKQVATKDAVIYLIEATSDLAIWTEPVTELDSTTAAAVQAAIIPVLPTLDTGWEWHTFRTAGGTAADPMDAIRLKVTSN